MVTSANNVSIMKNIIADDEPRTQQILSQRRHTIYIPKSLWGHDAYTKRTSRALC